MRDMDNSTQIIDLLTTEELMLTLPREQLVPRTYAVRPGQSLLIAALGRLDYLEGNNNIKMTVLAAASLPVTICSVADVEAVYHHYLGSEALAVPCGSQARLRQWPGLSAAQPFTLRGLGWRVSCADIVLSSAGWIALTAEQDLICKLQAYTPQARGVHVRIPPLLPRVVSAKGRRMFQSQAYAPYKPPTHLKARRR